MKSIISFVVLAIATSGLADSADTTTHKWIAPKSTDLRSPCPGLNTLANHGYLPRDGRGLTIAAVIKAGIDGFNVQPDVLTLAAKAGLLTTAALDTFTLDDIKLHDTIEHDASVSRGDFALGDNLHFNETIFQALANSNPGVDYYNATSAGQVQKQRLAESQATNPQLINTEKEIAIRTRESSLYLSVMGNPITGVAPKKFVNIFFREERMPIAEGWKRPNVSITGDTLGPMSGIIFEASEWSPNITQCPSIVLTLDSTSFFVV
ncbi:Cloroperoxidase [Mycena floridula]|nr:Cloroperoxidase [Mycena floridula]